jgi:hypothetical protein
MCAHRQALVVARKEAAQGGVQGGDGLDQALQVRVPVDDQVSIMHHRRGVSPSGRPADEVLRAGEDFIQLQPAIDGAAQLHAFAGILL